MPPAPPSPPPLSDPEPPALTPEIVEDEEALGEAVDEFVRRDPEARARLHEIADLQEALRRCPEIMERVAHGNAMETRCEVLAGEC